MRNLVEAKPVHHSDSLPRLDAMRFIDNAKNTNRVSHFPNGQYCSRVTVP